MAQSTDCGATVVKADFVWRPCPRESIHLQVIVQEFDELTSSGPDLANIGRLLDMS